MKKIAFANMPYMTNMNVCGHKVKVAVLKDGRTREKVVALVQDLVADEGLTFSLAGLDKLFKGELPKRDPGKIMSSLAKVLGLSVSDFAESEAQSA
jgi:hypothetical protein